MAAELSALDGARVALSSGDSARALSILDRYTSDFPHGALAPEATLLRIEALVAAGDGDGARRTAAAFLASHPDSPYAKRIASLLDEAR
jgi:outer membrane protein assembly factor BamD (BamD/ComL family)